MYHQWLSVPLLVTALWLSVVLPLHAQPAQIQVKKQEKEGSPVQDLTLAEREALNDPLFLIVLKEHADAITLAKIEEFLLHPQIMRHVFVVEERIQSATPDGTPRRAVLAYTGSHPAGFVLNNNVMLSLMFTSQDSQDLAEQPLGIEAWGWDGKRGRFNYYKLDQAGSPGTLSWKFRGSSDGAEKLSREQRADTCMACHLNGAPVMKELALPWNNWHSDLSRQSYLEAGSQGAWPAVHSPRLQGSLHGAQDLEGFLRPAITRFNRERIDASLELRADNGAVAVDAEGFAKVVDARRLLRPLFVTTEFNLISSDGVSGLHPFSDSPQNGPGAEITVPNGFFLNVDIIGHGNPHYNGLQIAASQEFETFAKVKPDEYKRLVTTAGVRLRGKPAPGDTHFAWFVPAPSHTDDSMIDLLMKQKIVTPQFVAAVLAVDLRTPVFSKDRASLLAFVPATFRFKRTAAELHPDNELTRKTVEALEAQPLLPAPAAEFLRLLKSADPLLELRQQVQAYRNEVDNLLSDPQTRPQELKRLFDLAIARRQEVLRDPVFEILDETRTPDGTGSRLFSLPLPSP